MNNEAAFNQITDNKANGNMTDREEIAYASAMNNAHDSEREGITRFTAEWYTIFVSTYNAWFDEN